MIFGVSAGSAASHRRFRAKEDLPFDLLVDPGFELCRQFDVDVTNLLVFKIVARVTYLIGKDGLILEAFARVDPKTHAADVLCRV